MTTRKFRISDVSTIATGLASARRVNAGGEPKTSPGNTIYAGEAQTP